MISLIYGRSAPIPADNDDEDDAPLGYSSEDVTKPNETGTVSDPAAGGFHSHGGTPRYGWFLRENPIENMDDGMGGSPF